MDKRLQLVHRESPEMRKYKIDREEKDITKRRNFAGVYLTWLSRTDLGVRGATKAITEAHAAGRYQPGLKPVAADVSGDP